jgi:hypothetical protein
MAPCERLIGLTALGREMALNLGDRLLSVA